ncbi:MAG: hypothetical protein HFJ34_02730 [Clostridia bacterium]|nr:hypothetical protein [Clostridia bacterium]
MGKATITAKTVDGKYSVTSNVTVTDGTNEGVDTSKDEIGKDTTTNGETKKGILPKTGKKEYIFIGLIIVTIAYIFYKKYNKYKGI